jgi:hypothetical protein
MNMSSYGIEEIDYQAAEETDMNAMNVFGADGR